LNTSKNTVHTLECSHDGRVKWRKQIYIPASERQAAYDWLLAKLHGEFFYNLVGDVKVVQRKPRDVDRWND